MLLEADGKWYQKRETDVSGAEHWRDPFVFEHEGRWHMLITARAKGAEHHRAGVIGHAVSEDLDHWQVRPPLTSPSVFGQLEVSQSRCVEKITERGIGNGISLIICAGIVAGLPSGIGKSYRL